MSEDPLGFRGGINFYAYADNDPIDVLDPFGLAPQVLGPLHCASRAMNSPKELGGRRVSIDLRHSQVEFTEFYSLGVC